MLNDVDCELDKYNMLTGYLDPPVSQFGRQQSIQISQFVFKLFPVFDIVLASRLVRSVKLLHQIRLLCRIKSPHIRYSENLSERNFGVLNGTKFSSGLQSDLFRHSRICAEGGESVAQCVDRSMKFLRQSIAGNKFDILCLSHPFLCQIICNSICNVKQTILTQFWLNKGAMLVSNIKEHIFHPSVFYNGVTGTELKMDAVYEVLI